MDDTEFLDAFHNHTLPVSEFRHRGHLRLTWLILSHNRPNIAADIITREIKRFATAQGDAGRYHETLTRFWVHLVNHARENGSDAGSIDELLNRFPILLDKNLPYKHWSTESFNSPAARNTWVPPDLLPLP